MIEHSTSQGVCILRLDAPPVNAITPALLEELRGAVRRANADAQVCGIVITGGPEHFSAGADVNLFREARGVDDAVQVSCVFQEALQEVEDSPKPVVAAVAGKVLGCAVELAAACHYRVCTRDTQFGMPEVTLGINPGAGGTARLPRLIGVQQALRMLLTGATVGAEEALAMGLVDTLCGADELIEQAKGFAGQGRPARKTRELTEKVRDKAANDAALEAAMKLLAKGRIELIAPRLILEAVRAGVEESFEVALRKEQEAVPQCLASQATQNKLYLFFATREASKFGEMGLRGAECRITRVGVVGMGSMGTGIAQAFLSAGLPVVVLDENPTALARGRERIARSLDKRVGEGKLTRERAERMLGLLTTTTDWAALGKADWVAEAVFEDVATKREVLARIEEVCRPGAIIASNTSTLSLNSLAEGMRHPERLVGMHFFNPAHVMPLVEVVRREATPPEAIRAALATAKMLRKTPVLVRNREGFLVNRIFIPYLKEAFWLLEEGAAPEAIDTAMADFGFPMGPLALIDMAGIDILAATDAVLARAFPRHGPLPESVGRLVAMGRLGQKMGGGVYDYAPGDHTPRPSEATARLLADLRRGYAANFSAAQIAQRLVMRMVAEAFWVLEEGIAERESDIDVAMVLGTGFPDFRGGVLKYARDLGLESVRRQLETMTERFGERFAPPTA